MARAREAIEADLARSERELRTAEATVSAERRVALVRGAVSSVRAAARERAATAAFLAGDPVLSAEALDGLAAAAVLESQEFAEWARGLAEAAGDPSEKDRLKAMRAAADSREKFRRELQAFELAEARAEVERNHAQAIAEENADKNERAAVGGRAA